MHLVLSAAQRPPKFHAEHGSRTDRPPSFHSSSGRLPGTRRRAPNTLLRASLANSRHLQYEEISRSWPTESAIMIGKQSATTPTVAWTRFIISRLVSIPALFR